MLVTIFTFLLFLSGYVLQQRTLHELQQTIKPRIPTRPVVEGPAAALAERIGASRLFGGREERAALQQSLQAGEDVSQAADWKKLAHIQLVRRHQDVCNSIMIFSDLAQHKSPARRILLFPQEWAIESAAGAGEFGDPYLVTSIRLLRMAARRYAVELRPITPILKNQAEDKQDVYSLASALALVDLDRALNVEAPGSIVSAARFDAMLAFTEDAQFAILDTTSSSAPDTTDQLYMLQPSSEKHTEIVSRIAHTESYNDTLFAAMFSDPVLLPAEDDGNVLIRSVGQLHDVQESFNASAFMLTAAYISFSDPKLPGPEWEVPYEQRREARPANHDADWLWTELYGQFAQKRADICGLGLEPWRV